MRRLIKSATVAALSLLPVACYHAIIDTGLQPSAETISQPWAHSFIAGLVPPKVVETAAKCKNGVAKVSTQHSFLNLVAAFVTFSIYTPMQIDVTCSTGAKAGDDAAATLDAKDDPATALNDAANLAIASGRDVYVRF
jgi:hypothetical protein